MQQTERRFAAPSAQPLKNTTTITERAGHTSEHQQTCTPLQKVWATGVTDIDTHLPLHGLALGGVHEVVGRTHLDATAASGFALAILRRLMTCEAGEQRETVLWCHSDKAKQETGLAYGPGLRMFGLEHLHPLFVRAARERDVLWALEEGARSGVLRAVVGEVAPPSFTQSRRLSFAASATQTPILLLHSTGNTSTSAASTRWHVNAIPGAADLYDPRAPGRMRWHVALGKCRGGKPGDWKMEWNHEAYRLDLVDELSTRLPEPQTEKNGTVIPLHRPVRSLLRHTG